MNMDRKMTFEEPTVDVICFDAEDVITTSCPTDETLEDD